MNDEYHIPTSQKEAAEHAWFPGADGIEKREESAGTATFSREKEADDK